MKKILIKIISKSIILCNVIITIFVILKLTWGKIKRREFLNITRNYGSNLGKFRSLIRNNNYRLKLNEKKIELILELLIKGKFREIIKLKKNITFINENSISYKKWISINKLNKKIVKIMSDRYISIIKSEDVKFSIVLPTFKSNINFLRECIDSVINQIYQNWELIIIDDGSNQIKLKKIIDSYVEQDKRISVIYKNNNEGIVQATNLGLQKAIGQYIGFLDHDDSLSEDALFQIYNAIASNTDIKFLYTDEDKIDSKGDRHDPNQKGGWNEIMAGYHNYTHHFSIYSSDILSKVGLLDQNCEGAQDFDLNLRAQEFLKPENIQHIPHVCYHWRSHKNSTASRGNQKDYVLMAAKKAIEKSLKRKQINTELFIPEIAKKYNWTLFQPRFKFKSVKDHVTIIIPTKNNAKLLLNCINSIKKTSLQMPQVIVLNDNSKEEDALELFNELKKDKNIQILNSPYMDDKFNYARLINYGASNVKTKYFIQLNNDVEAISNNWIEQMLGWYQYNNVGAVGAKLIYPNGRLQHAGVVIGPNGGLADHQFHGLDRNEPGYAALPHIAREVSAVTGACMLTETSLFLEMGGFDEANFAVEFNDVDYCIRLQRFGKKIIYDPALELLHITSASRGKKFNPQEHINFLEKYKNYKDSYFSCRHDINNMRMEKNNSLYIHTNLGQQLRLILVTHSLTRTGAPTTALEFCLAMKSYGYEIHVISYEDGALAQEFISHGITLHQLNLDKNIYNIGKDEIIDKIEKCMISLNINKYTDIVIGNTLLTFPAISIAKKNDLKTLWNIHENIDYLTFSGLIGDEDLRDMAIQTLEDVDLAIFQSDATKILFDRYIEPEKSIKISGGMPTKRINNYLKNTDKNALRRRHDIPIRNHVISIIGTTCDRKGQIEFIEAIGSINWLDIGYDIDELTILVVGRVDSKYSDDLIDYIARHKNIDIRIIDEVSNIYDYYLLTDIFVCASKEESFPMVVLLAMAFHIPVVSTKAGGIEEMLQDEFEGILTDGYGAKDIKLGILRMLKKDDTDIMTKRAYAKLLRYFDNDFLYDQHDNIIKKLINN